MVEPIAAMHSLSHWLAALGTAEPGSPLSIATVDAGLATVMARRDGGAGIADRLGMALPAGPARARDATMALLGTGPGVWLAMAEGAGPCWAEELAERLSGVASVVDQSGGYAVLRLAGPGALTLLSRGAFVDFDAAAFPTGSVMVTDIAHMGVIIARIDDAPSFHVALFRSHAESFAHWIEATARGMGVQPLASVGDAR